MIDGIAAAGTELVGTYGLVVIFVVFALEGALVGKLIPARALFVAAVLLLGTDGIGLLTVVLAAVVGATVGQLAVFTLIRRTSVTVDALPGELPTTDTRRLQAWLDRWGVPAIAVSNVLPVVRGTLTVPAAMGEETAVRFSTASVLGTTVYAGVLVVIAVGLDAMLTAL